MVKQPKNNLTKKRFGVKIPKIKLPKLPKFISKPLGIIKKGFLAIGRYFKYSWIELRQVRWPNRKATWSLTLAVLLFTAFFFILIVLLDAGFKELFNLILK
jgi:preprotein translocase subunit SecE